MNKILLFTPMYNCEKQIVRVLDQITPEIARYISEWIIVNNRSTDDGETAVINYLQTHDMGLNVSLLRNDENYGLGGSHKVAFDYAIKNNFDYVIVLHGDDQGDIANILPYLKNKEYEKYDCFLGARFMKGSQLQGYSVFRTLGNKVYNVLFSMGCGLNIKDLGSGLNMYKVSILKDSFYIKYTDNLTFNCYMLMGHKYYKHKVCFFPIIWREDDQVSNVKMVNQAIYTLKILWKFMRNRAFVNEEHRDKIIDNYSAKVVDTNQFKSEEN